MKINFIEIEQSKDGCLRIIRLDLIASIYQNTKMDCDGNLSIAEGCTIQLTDGGTINAKNNYQSLINRMITMTT